MQNYWKSAGKMYKTNAQSNDFALAPDFLERFMGEAEISEKSLCLQQGLFDKPLSICQRRKFPKQRVPDKDV